MTNKLASLEKILSGNLSDDELDKSYFNKNFWTLEQFAALIVNLSPERYIEIRKSDGNNISLDDKNRIVKAHDIQIKFLKDVINKKVKGIQFIGKEIEVVPLVETKIIDY